MKSTLRILLAAAVLFASASVLSLAQDPEDGPKFQPRLPAYFANVVTEAQKAEIYETQKTYNEKIAPLREQIRKLEEERDAAIDAVLSAEQLAKIEQARKDAKDRRDLLKELTPEQRRAAEDAARKAFEEAVKNAQGKAGDTTSAGDSSP